MDIDNNVGGVAIESTQMLGAGLYVIEGRARRQDKTLSPWRMRAAFADRQDAFDVYGKWHQRESTRVLSPNAPADLPAVAGKVRRDVGRKVDA
jgi:hypothetical protein